MRDPRTDPQAGDRVQRGKKIRAVILRTGNDITWMLDNGRNGAKHVCWITTWQDWCAKPDCVVLKAAVLA